MRNFELSLIRGTFFLITFETKRTNLFFDLFNENIMFSCK